ncbi:serine hydrolase [Paenibacillus pabuli]|uniref:serine hydrolase domain-containing protein n=1 Tax=Paenibacillus pabuli TaxID=1472 RepID=UPI003CE81A78
MSSSIRKIFGKIMVLVLLGVTLGTTGLGTVVPVSAAVFNPGLHAGILDQGAAANLDDSDQLTAFIDGIMDVQMGSLQIPGAVVSIVKDGKILLSKGYGHSNIEENKAVDPKTSLFRIASTTKLFTWTAVMQLVEAGKLDLDTDVNTYLKTVKIPKTYKQPITLRHLMTHTAGFEEGGVGYQITTDPGKLPVSIAETMEKHMPARVKPPGEMLSYSNYGASLAGLIVEEVSGVAYNDYIQKNIFDPLDMKYATVEEPVPASLEPYAVLGYARANGEYVTKRPTYEGGFRPAGSGSVSANDMAHFMIAHLQNGRYEDKQMLKPETARLMHSPAFQFDERLPAMDLGFYELNMNGLRVISHGGADELFNTALYLVPDQQVGIFVSYSGGDGGTAAGGLAQAFFDRYYPAHMTQQPAATSIELGEPLEKYAGSYQFTRRNHTKIDKFFSFLTQINIEVSDNRLSIGSGADQQVYTPIGVNLFQEVGGKHQMGFRTDAEGKVTYLFLDMLNPMPLEPAPLINQSKFWLTLLGISVVLFITVFMGAMYRRREIKAKPRAQKWAVWLSVVMSVWSLVTLGATLLVMNMDLIDRLSYIPLSLRLYLFMPLILVGLTASIFMMTILAWKNKYWTLPRRVYYTFVTLAAVTLCLFFDHWNLLGWHFG